MRSNSITTSQKSYFLILIFCFLTIKTFSQRQEQNLLHLNKDYISSYFSDGVSVAKAPLRWNNRQWAGFAAFGGATLLLYTQDDIIQDFFTRNQTTTGLDFSKKFINPLATYYLAGFVGGMYLYGLASGNQQTETAALLTAKSVIVAGTYGLIFKGVFQRQRPNHIFPSDKSYWGGPFDGFKHGAFPSGHTTVAFAAATTLSAYYNDKKWVGITAYSLAVLVAASRVYENEHWSSDVLAGAVLGYAIGRLVYNNNNQKITIAPTYKGLSHGINVRYVF